MRPVSKIHRPDSVNEACKLAKTDGAIFISGGQSLTQMMKQRIVGPDELVDLSSLSDELSYIQNDSEYVRIGGLVVHNDIGSSAIIKEEFPAFASMIDEVADDQVRNMGTIGGDLAQADPSSDFPVMTMALNADYELQAVNDSRTIAAEQFFQGAFETDLNSGELITEIRIPKQDGNTTSGFQKFAKREGDFAIVNIAVQVQTEDGVCKAARIVAGAVVDTPQRLSSAEETLENRELGKAAIEEAAEEAQAAVDPLDDPVNGSAQYKQNLVHSLTKRALNQSINRLEE